MSLTQKQIAMDLNLSMATVSRVMNGKTCVSDEVRHRVLAYLKEHDQMSLMTQKTQLTFIDLVAVVIPDISETYFNNVVREIETCLWKERIGMLLCDSIEDIDKESQYMNMLIAKNFTGIILATIDKDAERLTSYHQQGMNIVYFDNLPNITIPYNAVITDNVKSSILAVNHLAALGHKRIGFISGRQEETTGFERLVGFRRAMDLNNLPVSEEQIVFGDYKELSGYQGMCRLLDACEGLTAVYISSSKMTFGALKALEERGLNVPRDIALVGFDVHDHPSFNQTRITSIIQNEEQIGSLCVDLLLRQKNGQIPRKISSQRILIEPRLVIGQSCGS